MTYYNTTHESGQDLARFNAAADTQEAAIVRYMQHREADDIGRGSLYASPSYLWDRVFRQRVPITSVRRSLTNLTRAGVLEKTDHKRPGPFGRPEYTWRLRKPAPSPSQQQKLI